MRQSLPLIRCPYDARRITEMTTDGTPLNLHLVNKFFLTKQAEAEIRNAGTRQAVADALFRHYGPRSRN